MSGFRSHLGPRWRIPEKWPFRSGHPHKIDSGGDSEPALSWSRSRRASKLPKRAPKGPPGGPQNGPRDPQEALKRRPEAPPERAKRPQDWPREPQDGPRERPDSPRRPQKPIRGPKGPPRSPQQAPREPRAAPGATSFPNCLVLSSVVVVVVVVVALRIRPRTRPRSLRHRPCASLPPRCPHAPPRYPHVRHVVLVTDSSLSSPSFSSSPNTPNRLKRRFPFLSDQVSKLAVSLGTSSKT